MGPVELIEVVVAALEGERLQQRQRLPLVQHLPDPTLHSLTPHASTPPQRHSARAHVQRAPHRLTVRDLARARASTAGGAYGGGHLVAVVLLAAVHGLHAQKLRDDPLPREHNGQGPKGSSQLRARKSRQMRRG
eukprot:3873000-Rhodomonas_salina.1